MGFNSDRGLKSWLALWASYSLSLNLSFLICEVGTMMPVSQNC